MTKNMIKLIKRAREKYSGKEITFCGTETNWEDCFTVENNMLVLWFNIVGTIDTKAIMGEV